MGEVLKHIELIENYAEGNLSEQETHDFEIRLLTDSEFNEEYKLYKLLVDEIKAKGEANLKAKLTNADLKLDSRSDTTLTITKGKRRQLYYSIAAGVILIMGISFIWKLSSGTNLPEIANSIYEKEKGLPVEMSASNSNYINILNDYKTGKYQEAESLLLNLEKINLANDTTNFYLAIVQYELGSYKTAEHHLNIIEPSSTFFQKAEYRSLLISLKLNEKEQAIKYCKQILSNANHPYFDKATLVSKVLLPHK